MILSDAEIVTRYLAGERVKRLCGGGSTTPVYRALRRAGIEPQRFRVWWQEAARLKAEGLCQNRIAVALGRTPKAVNYALRQMQPPIVVEEQA